MTRVLLLLLSALAAYAIFSLCNAWLLSGVEARAGYVDALGARVYFVQWLPSTSSVKGTVVLLHGLGGSVEMMSWLGVELARSGFKVIAYDNLGHGKSSSRLQPFDVERATRVYFAVLSALGVGENDGIVLIGHSMGGYFAQEIAKVDARVKGVVVIASRPYLNASVKRIALLAAHDEIFSIVHTEGWDTVVLPYDDHLTILYNPAAINAVLARIVEGTFPNLAPLRLLLTVARSISALAATLSFFYLIGGRLSLGAKACGGSFSYRSYILAAALSAPLAFPLYTLLSPITSLVAAYVLALVYSQSIGLAVMHGKRTLSLAELRGRDLAKSVLLSLSLALAAYAGLHEALQPFFNVEPSVYRLHLLIVVFALSLPPALVFEATLRRGLLHEPISRGLLKVAGFRAASFASAYAAARLAIGAQGLSGYLLIVTYISLCLILPLDAAAQAWLRRSRSWVENAIWLALAQSLLLTAVTPLT